MTEQSEWSSPESPSLVRGKPKPTLTSLSCAFSWKSAQHSCDNKAGNTSLTLLVLPADFCILRKRSCD